MGSTIEDVSTSIGAGSASMVLPQLSAFVSVVGAGSFTRAARLTGVDKTILSRRVSALERALSVRLLHRTTRRVALTDAGRNLYERTATPLSELLKVLSHAAAPEPVEGLVRVASTATLADDLWIPLVGEFRSKYPKLQLEIRANERFVDLVEGGFDFAVRTGRLPDSSLVAKRIATWRYVLCGSPDWLSRHRELSEPADLAPHWLFYPGVPNADRWKIERGDQVEEIRVKPVMSSDNAEVLVSAARAGLGVAAFAPVAVEEHLSAGRLVRLLPEWRVAHTHGVYTVMTHRAHIPPRVQVVVDGVVARLKTLERRWSALSS